MKINPGHERHVLHALRGIDGSGPRAQLARVSSQLGTLPARTFPHRSRRAPRKARGIGPLAWLRTPTVRRDWHEFLEGPGSATNPNAG